MRTRTRISFRKSAANRKAVEIVDGMARRFFGSAARLRKKWRFAPDAIGMVEGPRDLSRRKGLSA